MRPESASGCALRLHWPYPGPRNGGPAALRWTDFAKFDGAHPACLTRKFSPLYGGYLVSHHGTPQNLFPLRLTALARRGSTMRGAPGSRCPQRGRITVPSTPAHNRETQAQKDNGRVLPFSDHSGPGRPGRHRSKVRDCAPDARVTFPIGLPLGPGPQARGTLATFLPWKVARPRAKHPYPSSRPQAITPIN